MHAGMRSKTKATRRLVCRADLAAGTGSARGECETRGGAKPPDEVQGSLWAGKDGNVIQVREDALTEVRPDIKLQIPQRCTQA